MSVFRLPHRVLYRDTRALPAPPCQVLAEYVGVFFVRELGRKCMLYHCPRCESLIAVADHAVLWEMTTPPAAVPIAAEEVTP